MKVPTSTQNDARDRSHIHCVMTVERMGAEPPGEWLEVGMRGRVLHCLQGKSLDWERRTEEGK